jgi:fumarate reductase subunit C
MIDARLYFLQRLSALIMVPLVFGHLAVMIISVQGGVTAAEILARTSGSLAWASYYGLFVFAAAVHGAIGVRAVAAEQLRLRARWLGFLSWAIFAIFLATGLRAVHAVTMAGV